MSISVTGLSYIVFMVVDNEYQSKAHERVVIFLAGFIGIAAFIYGLLLVVAPGGDIFFLALL